MGAWGHMSGAQPLYTFQHLLDDLKLLSDNTWETLNFHPPLKSICLWLVSKSLLHQQIDEGHWGRLGEIGQDKEQLAYLFITLLTQAGAECHYGVVAVWCHPAQSKVNIHLAFKEM